MAPDSRPESFYLKSIRNILMIFLGMLLIYLAGVLKSILIPITLAFFLALLLLPFLKFQIRVGIPKVIGITMTALLVTSAIVLLAFLISISAKNMGRDLNVIQDAFNQRLDQMIVNVSKSLGLSIEKQSIMQGVFGADTFDWLLKTTTGLALQVTTITADFVIMNIYMIALLAGMTHYDTYLKYLEKGSGYNKDANSGESFLLLNAFNQIQDSIFKFLAIKFLASLATGLAFGMICWAFGVKFALILGFIAFAMNFIPTIGSIIATIPPVILGLFLIPSTGLFLLFVALLGLVQFTVGNILEPRFQGENLGINFISIIFGLVFFGMLWGPIGMLLSVPLLVLVRIVLMQLPETDWVVRLMSPYSEIKSQEAEES